MVENFNVPGPDSKCGLSLPSFHLTNSVELSTTREATSCEVAR
jgi:hypothetical protein